MLLKNQVILTKLKVQKFIGVVCLKLTHIDYVEQQFTDISDDTDTDDSSEDELDEDDDPYEEKKTIKHIQLLVERNL